MIQIHIIRALRVIFRLTLKRIYFIKYEDRIPIDYQTALMAEELNMNLVTAAMNGGEDYELLFTVPIADHEKVSQMEGIRLIGHITKPELGCALITRDGQEFELKAQGWNPLKEDK